jgi:hypothetical protein
MLRVTIRHIFYCILLITTAGQWNCRPDVEEFRAFAGSAEDIRRTLAQAPAASSDSVFTFRRGVPDTTLTLASGLSLELRNTEQLFANEAGATVPCSTCNDLRIEIAEAPRKGDLIGRGISAIGPDKALIDIATAVRIRVVCDGRALRLLPNRTVGLYLPITRNAALFPVASVYSTNESATGIVAPWGGPAGSNQNTVSPIVDTTPQGDVRQGYKFSATTLEWIACGRPVVNVTMAINTCARLPKGFDLTNTQIWWVSEDLNIAAQMPQSPDDTQEYCLTGTPIGESARIIAMAKTGLQWWISDTPFNPENTPLVNVRMTPVEEAAVLALLRGL